jgi:hypothetical protein
MTAPTKKKGVRTFSQMLGASNTVSDVPTYTAKRVNVTNQKWSDLSQTVADERASVLKHKYKVAGTTKHGSIELSHTHGEFNKRLKASATGDVEINTHNIATAELGRAPRSFPKILESISTKKGATDALRVLKGTHLTKGLTGSTPEKRQAAVELGAEIGVSEYTRGASAALTDAAINLYRMKHGKLSKTDFADHEKGYTGAGKGGAERLRALGSIVDVFKPYDASLRSVYDSHASIKAKRPWEATLGPKATADEKFDAWRAHKFQKWTQREK